jgi:hypothetical protein
MKETNKLSSAFVKIVNALEWIIAALMAVYILANIIIDHSTMVASFFGVFAVGILFVIRKYLFMEDVGTDK